MRYFNHSFHIYKFVKSSENCNDPMFWDRQACANILSRPRSDWRSLIRVYTVCHSVGIIWMQYPLVQILECSQHFIRCPNLFVFLLLLLQFYHGNLLIIAIHYDPMVGLWHRNFAKDFLSHVNLSFCKNLKNLDTRKICCNHSKLGTRLFLP